MPTCSTGAAATASRGLPETARARVKLLNDDVRTVEHRLASTSSAHSTSATSASRRATRCATISRASRKALNPDGLFFLDSFGGPDASDIPKEKTKHRRLHLRLGAGRVRAGHGPDRLPHSLQVSGRVEDQTRVHLRLAAVDAARAARAACSRPGFCKVRVYWEGDDGEGGGNGEFKEHATGEPDLAWIAYLVAEK